MNWCPRKSGSVVRSNNKYSSSGRLSAPLAPDARNRTRIYFTQSRRFRDDMILDTSSTSQSPISQDQLLASFLHVTSPVNLGRAAASIGAVPMQTLF